MVRKERLELSRVAPLEPKSSAYTNFATFAHQGCHDKRQMPELQVKIASSNALC